MSWWYLVVLVVAAIVAYSMTPDPPDPIPPNLQQLSIPTAEEGRPIPVVFGTYVVTSPNIIWYGDLDYKAVKTKGGK